MSTAELQKQIQEWTQRQTQLQGEVATLQAQLGQAALSGAGALAELKQEYRAKSEDLDACAAALAQLRAQLPAAAANDLRSTAEQWLREAEELKRQAREIHAQAKPLYEKLAELEGPNWRHAPRAGLLLAHASNKRLNGQHRLGQAEEKERQNAKQQ